MTTSNHGDLSSFYRTSSTVETSPLSDGGLMIVELDSGGCWQLNRVGAELWELFQTGSSLESAIAVLAARYAVSRDTLLVDLVPLVRDLCVHGLILPGTTA